MTDIKKMFPDHWNELRNIRELKNVPMHKLQKELTYLHQEGKLLRNRNERVKAVIGVINALGAAHPIMKAAYDALCALPEHSVKDFDAVVKTLLVKRKLIPLEKLKEQLGSGIQNLLEAQYAFGLSVGVAVNSTKQKWPHASPLRHMTPVTGMAMRSWKRLTGKDVRSPKGLSEGGPYGLRPDQDDIYYVFLCLNLAGLTEEPSNAITSVKRARRQLASLPKGTASMKRLFRNMLDAEQVALRKIYGIKG